MIDGSFDDWRGAPVVARATNDHATLTEVSARQDDHYIYLRLSFSHPVNLLGLDSTLSLAFDADGNPTTGADLAGLTGAELEVDFSPVNATTKRIAEGVSVRTTTSERPPDAYTIGLVTQPTTTSRTFELRLSRGRRRGDSTMTAPVFTGASYRARISVRDPGGVEREALPTFTVALSSFKPPLVDQPTDPLARATGTDLRILQWNVANEGIAERPDRFRRVFAAIDPDVLLLDEVGGSIGADGVARFLAVVDSGRYRGPWRFTYGGGGGYQRTVVASHGNVAELPEFKFIAFPESFATAILARVPEAGRTRVRASMDSGVATGAAVVTIGGHRLAIFGVDLQSAGNRSNSWQEARRVAETRIVRDFATRWLRTGGEVDGVIAAGDLNLVSTRNPLDTLASIGVGFDGHMLTPAQPLQLDRLTASTWDGGAGPFPPGRLDWVTYSERTLELRGAFVFDARDLSERWRSAHGLEPDDSQRSSDHMPIVVDLKWKR